jgi:hypothetical protein
MRSKQDRKEAIVFYIIAFDVYDMSCCGVLVRDRNAAQVQNFIGGFSEATG